MLLLLCFTLPLLGACTINRDGLEGADALLEQAASYLNSLQTEGGSSDIQTEAITEGAAGTDTEAVSDSDGTAADGTQGEQNERPSQGDGGNANAPSNGTVEDTLPDPSATLPTADLGGKQINILIGSERIGEYLTTSEDQTVLGRDIYLRHTKTYIDLNCMLNYIQEPSGEGFVNSFCQTATRLTAEGSVDLFATHSLTASPLMTQGYLKNLHTADVLSLDAKWWNQSLIENCTVYNKLYFCSGDISHSLYDNTYAFFYNREMEDLLYDTIANMGYEDGIYTLVQNGDWTLDVMIRIAENAYTDADASASKSLGDCFGYTAYLSATDSFFQGGGLQQIANSKQGLSLSVDMNTDAALPLIERMQTFLASHEATVKGGIGEISGWGNNGPDWLWNEKRVLFYHAPLSELTQESKVNRGILPVPKYDWSQDSYLTCPDFDFTVWSMCKSGYGEAVYVLEYLAQLGYYSVTPAYFHGIMRNAVQSEQDQQMLDCICEGIVIDSGRIYDGIFKTPMNSFWRGAMQDREYSYVSNYEPNKIPLSRQIDELNQWIEDAQ